MDEFDNDELKAQEAEPKTSRNWRAPSFKRPNLRRPEWLSHRAMVGAAIVLVLVLLFVGRSIHHHLNNTGVAVKHPSGTTQTKQPTSPSLSKTQNQSPKPSANQPKPTELVNTGPGATLAVFAVASLAATSVHYVLRSKHQS